MDFDKVQPTTLSDIIIIMLNKTGFTKEFLQEIFKGLTSWKKLNEFVEFFGGELRLFHPTEWNKADDVKLKKWVVKNKKETSKFNKNRKLLKQKELEKEREKQHEAALKDDAERFEYLWAQKELQEESVEVVEVEFEAELPYCKKRNIKNRKTQRKRQRLLAQAKAIARDGYNKHENN